MRAAATAVLVVIGKLGLCLYGGGGLRVRRGQLDGGRAAVAALVGQIFFFGLDFTHVYAGPHRD